MACLLDSREKEAWLLESLQSIFEQDFTEWELIIVDDNSPIRVKEFEDERIRVVRTVESSGPAICRNTAAALASSEAILPLDSDDLFYDSGVLSTLWRYWNPKKIVYGDLQRIAVNAQGVFTESEPVTILPEYTFEKSLDLQGLIPITALHSLDCWHAIGGWRKELTDGLEDVEYYIHAGEHGYCGQKIKHPIIKYRMHTGSRSYKLKTSRDRGKSMRDMIRTLHEGSYRGEDVMGCGCGGASNSPNSMAGLTSNVSNASALSNSVRRRRPMAKRGATEPNLEAIDQEIFEVTYTGRSQASFSVIGQNTGVRYEIAGPQAKIAVFEYDLPKFRRAGRGLDFVIGGTVNALAQNNQEIPKEPQTAKSDRKPDLAMIERMV